LVMRSRASLIARSRNSSIGLPGNRCAFRSLARFSLPWDETGCARFSNRRRPGYLRVPPRPTNLCRAAAQRGDVCGILNPFVLLLLLFLLAGRLPTGRKFELDQPIRPISNIYNNLLRSIRSNAPSGSRMRRYLSKSLLSLVAGVGFEPTTFRL
jgi:hypothetical protein